MNDISEMPQWLLEKLRDKPALAARSPASLPAAVAPTRYGRDALEGELAMLRDTPEGGRNDQLNRSAFVAGQLAAGGQIDAQEAREALYDAALSTGLPPDEVERTLASGWHAGLKEPTGLSSTPGLVLAADAISATPFRAPNPTDIPHRPWVFTRWLLRRTVTTVIAPGGVGKSALMIATALSLATGKELLGKTVWDGPKRVWLWNLEDDRDELARQVVACAVHHGISSEDYSDRLFVNGAETGLCTAVKGAGGFILIESVYEAVLAEIRARNLDVLIIDPFVSSHQAEENDNGQIDAIVKRWAAIAREANCTIVLVHHSRKLGGQKVDAEAARGASALGNASRIVLVLNRMESVEARRFGIDEKDRRGYIHVSNDKSNRAPAGQADWFRIVSVKLANGGPEGGDSVGVVERWMPPDAALAASAFDDEVRARVQAEIASGEWRAHQAARDWAGLAIAKALGADVDDPTSQARVKPLLRDMLAKGQLRMEERQDASRHTRPFIVVGDPVAGRCDSPAW